MENEYEELAGKIAIQVIAQTAVLNDQLHEALVLGTNVATEPMVHNKVWLQIAYFGNYILFKKYSRNISPAELDAFKVSLKDQFIRYAMMVVFTGNDENFQVWLESQYLHFFELYEKHVGNTSELLKKLISANFVLNDSKIKFVENKFPKRALLSLSGILGGIPQGEILLSDEVLTKFSTSVFDTFVSIEI